MGLTRDGELADLEARISELTATPGGRFVPGAATEALAALRHPDGMASKRVDRVIALLKGLYAESRSVEGVQIAEALDQMARGRGSVADRLRALSAAGLVLGDAGDPVRGIDKQVMAMRLASETGNDLEVCRSWNNIGVAFGIAGTYSHAAACYLRAIAVAGTRDVHPRYAAHANLANGYFHLNQPEPGLRHAEHALEMLRAEYTVADPHSTLLLHRSAVRLLAQLGDLERVPSHLQAIECIARHATSARTHVAAGIALATYDLALDRVDVARTRFESVLRRAREVPAALPEALLFGTQLESFGREPGRAFQYLQELSSLVYVGATAKLKAHLTLVSQVPQSGLGMHEGLRHRLTADAVAQSPPAAWAAVQRIATAAVLGMDPSAGHGQRVGAMAKALALASGHDPLDALEIGAACQVHDIGLPAIPGHVLAKRSALTDDEQTLLPRHCESGAKILSSEAHPRMHLAREVARYHHARWDGRGYPARVRGNGIPVGARICAIADAYDAMVSGLYGRPKVPMEVALSVIGVEAGRQFDPELAHCFRMLVRDHMEDIEADAVVHPTGLDTFAVLLAALQEDRGFV